MSEPNEPVLHEQADGLSADRGSHQSFRLEDQRAEALAAAQQAVRTGRCIVMPTDTVYGIGADAFSAQAVRGLLEAKHRGRDMPPPVLIAEPAMLPALVAYVPISARAMIERFWPGALTLILRAQSSLHLDLGDTGGTIAVRVPDDDAARELLRHTGPLAVSSANVSGKPSATNVTDAEAMLGDSVDVYLDGGPTPGPVASTIVDFTQNPAGRILRRGIIGFEELHEVSAGLEDLPEPAEERAASAGTDTPIPGGQVPDPSVPEAPVPDPSVPEAPVPDPSVPEAPGQTDPASTSSGAPSGEGSQSENPRTQPTRSPAQPDEPGA